MSSRVGYGYDCHAFTEGDHFWLGGVRIDHDKGIRAHSDGDVLIHALCDALLGAAALGDIGEHFPDSDPQYRGQSSDFFLKHCIGLLTERGLAAMNIDATIILQSPKLGSYKQAIREKLAELSELKPEYVNIKATTAEGMGAIGAGAGIAAHCVVIIRPVWRIDPNSLPKDFFRSLRQNRS